MFDFTGETFNELESFLFSHSLQHFRADRRRDHSKLILNYTEPGSIKIRGEESSPMGFPDALYLSNTALANNAPS